MKNILCFGDSNTYGLVPATTQRYPWKVRWTSIIADFFRPAKYNVIEAGLCGRTTIFTDKDRPNRKGSDLLMPTLESNGPIDIVILMLGTNDCKSYFNNDGIKIAAGVELLLQQIKKFDQSIKVLLVSPIALRNGVEQPGRDPEMSAYSVLVSNTLGPLYQGLADKYNCAFLDARQVAKASSIDCEHLDERGHKQLAGAIITKLVTGRYVDL